MMGRKADEPKPLKLAEVQEVAKATGKTPAQVLVNV
jgi:diketogulonate reductase-like aldo/keto reductase